MPLSKVQNFKNNSSRNDYKKALKESVRVKSHAKNDDSNETLCTWHVFITVTKMCL